MLIWGPDPTPIDSLVEPRKGIGCRVGPGRQKKAPEGGPGLENTMRVVLV